jgi:hypothetical protein
MEVREKSHADKCKEITNDLKYDANCSLATLPVWDLENFNLIIFVAVSVHNIQHRSKTFITIIFSTLYDGP